MSTASWSLTPHTIHVNEDPAGVIARAETGGAPVFRWSLRGLRNYRELGASAEKLFQPPYRSPSLVGMVDYASDLEWLETPHGVLFVLDAEGARPQVVRDAVHTLPPVGDVWRGTGKPFEAYVTGVADVSDVLAELERTNAGLDEFGRKHPQSDTHRLTVSAPPQPAAVTAPRRRPILRWSRRGA